MMEALTEQGKAELMMDLMSAINHFAVDLYGQLIKEQAEENIFFSPASISFALAMTYLGARGKTAEQMAEVLHLDEVGVEPEYIHALFRRSHLTLGSGSNDYVLHTANRLYGHNEYAFLQDFLAACEYFYASELEAVDFVQDTEGARQKINRWVELMTNDKITDLIPPDVLSPRTRLVIVNAIYFKGDWEHQFKKSDTKDGLFYMNGTGPVPVKMMTTTETFWYGQSMNLKAAYLELPYQGNRLAMVIFLPDSRHGLAQLESHLTADIIMNPKQEFKIHKTKVMLQLPKFKLEASFDLDETLPDLGMVDIFDKVKSDLSGITKNNDLFVSKIVHKAYLNIDEKGTEAAAATGVIMNVRAMPQPPVKFIANHPFVFLIKDKLTKAILFMGRVTQPQPSDYSEPTQEETTCQSIPLVPTYVTGQQEEDEDHVTSLWVDPDSCSCENPPLHFPLT